MAAFLAFSPRAFAEHKLIDAEGYYTIGDGLDESIAVAKERARADALRNASEQAGVYVESLTIVQQGMLTQDEIQVIAAHVMQLQGAPSFKATTVGEDVIRYVCHVTALVDTDNINDKLLSDKQALSDAARRNNELAEEVERLNREMEQLKTQYARTTDEAERQELRQAARQNDAGFAAAQLSDEGVRLYNQGLYREAIVKFTQSLEQNPRYAYACNNRGAAYFCLQDYRTAIADFTQAIALDAGYAAAYVSRGSCYGNMKDYDSAIADFSKAISLDAQSAPAYIGRGFALYGKGDYAQAAADFGSAIRLDRNAAEAYYGRGNAYMSLQHYEEAMRDYRRALELKPQMEAARENLEMIERELSH